MRTLLLLALVAVLLAITNPGRDDFQAFAEGRAAELVAGQTGGKFGAFIAGVAGDAVASTLLRVTDRKNYYVASVYTIDLDGVAGHENEWTFLGIGTQFVELQRPAVLRGK